MDPAETVCAEDRKDIAESLAGNGEGFARLVRRYQDKVVAQMWRFTRDTVVLDQLVQDVFVEAFPSRSSPRATTGLFRSRISWPKKLSAAWSAGSI